MLQHLREHGAAGHLDLRDLKLTNEQLAAISGISRQFTNSTLQTLRKRGLVSGGREIVLTDLAALERIAYPET